MIISIPYGDILARYVMDTDNNQILFVNFADLAKLVNRKINPSLTFTNINRRMHYTMKLKRIGHKKFIPVNQIMNFLDNIHIDTREDTMYIMQSIQKELNDFL